MIKRIHGPPFADNKDISDLLSSHKVFKKPILRDLAFERGIVLSSRDSLQELIVYFSLLPMDMALVERLLELAAPPERHPPSTMRRFALSAIVDDVLTSAELVKNARGVVEKEDTKVTVRNDRIRIEIAYAQLDPSRTRMQQERTHEALIEVEVGKNSLLVRSTPGSRTDAYIEQMIDVLASDAPDPTLVDLSSLRTAEARTKFFLGLLDSMGDYATMEVTDLRVHPLDAPEGDGEVDDADDADDGEELPVKRFPKVERQMTAQLANASLQGSNLLTSPIYQELSKGGFFITRLQWLVKHKKTTDEATLEAWFHDAENAADFRYRVRSVAEAGGEPKRPDAAQNRALLKTIEGAADASLLALKDEFAAAVESLAEGGSK